MFKTGSQLLSFNRFSTLIYICIFSFPDIAEFCNLHDCHKQLCKVFTSENGTVECENCIKGQYHEVLCTKVIIDHSRYLRQEFQ